MPLAALKHGTNYLFDIEKFLLRRANAARGIETEMVASPETAVLNCAGQMPLAALKLEELIVNSYFLGAIAQGKCRSRH